MLTDGPEGGSIGTVPEDSARTIKGDSLNDLTARTVPMPRSMTSFLANFQLQNQPSQHDPLSKLEQVRRRPWARGLSEEELLRIAGEKPRLPTASSTALLIDKESEADLYRKRMSAIVPRHHKAAIDRLNEHLDQRQRQSEAVSAKRRFRKAPREWRGSVAELDVRQQVLHEVDLGKPDSDAADSDGELPSVDELLTSSRIDPGDLGNATGSVPAQMVIESDSDPDPGPDQAHKRAGKGGKSAQTDIARFLVGAKPLPVQKTKEERQREKREQRLRWTFLDEEAEESDSQAEEADDDLDASASQKSKRKKRIADEEFVDEDAIRKELAESRFIVEDLDSDHHDSDLLDVHRQLSMRADEQALQAVVDRFARDKLDPQARHLAALSTKYSLSGAAANHPPFPDADPVGDGDEIRFAGVTGHSSDSDRGGIDDLIEADSDAASGVSEYDSDSEQHTVSHQQSSRAASPVPANLADLFSLGSLGATDASGPKALPRGSLGLQVSAGMLSRLAPEQVTQQPKGNRQGFSIGRSLPLS